MRVHGYCVHCGHEFVELVKRVRCPFIYGTRGCKFCIGNILLFENNSDGCTRGSYLCPTDNFTNAGHRPAVGSGNLPTLLVRHGLELDRSVRVIRVHSSLITSIKEYKHQPCAVAALSLARIRQWTGRSSGKGSVYWSALRR